MTVNPGSRQSLRDPYRTSDHGVRLALQKNSSAHDTRLRPGATWQQADAEINRAWALRTNRYELAANPAAHVTYYSVSLQQGQTAKLRR